MNHKNILIYHGENCADGILSAYLMKKYFDFYNAEYVALPYTYDMPFPEDVTDCDVWIVDFSFPKDVIFEAAKTANLITVLDHHQTAADCFGGYRKDYLLRAKAPIIVELVKDKSGCQIVYDFLISLGDDAFNETFHHAELMAIHHIGARDRWVFETPTTKAFFLLWQKYVKSDIQSVSDFLNNPKLDILQEIQDSERSLAFKNNLIQQMLPEVSWLNLGPGYGKIPLLNVPKIFASDVGEALCNLPEKPSFSMTYCVVGDQIRVSLRSSKESGFNVAEIAEGYGGGGHINAAGYYRTIPEFNRYLNLYLTPKEENT